MKNTLEMFAPDLLVSKPPLLTASLPIGLLKESVVRKEEPLQDALKDELPKQELVKKDNPLVGLMELPVNNFLKTFKDIEAEFHFIVNSIKSAISEIPDTLDSFGRMMKKTDNSIPLSAISMELPEYLEENY